MKLLLAAAALAAMAVSAPAFAQTSMGPVTGYGTIGYSNTNSDGVNLGAITGRLGGRVRYVGAEGEASVGVTKDHDAGISYRVRDQFAGYLVGYLPLADSGDVFARVGYGTTDIKAHVAGIGVTVGEDSVNYGAGAQYFFNHGPHGVRAEYTRFDFTDRGAGAANVFSLSYVFRFGGH